MRHSITGLTASLVALAAVSAAQAAPVCQWQGGALSAQISQTQQNLVEAYLATRKVGDLAVTVVDGDRTAYLLCAAAGPVRATPQTRFEVGSLSKIFTGLLLAQAVADKRVGLDDDVRDYLPAAFDSLAFEGKPIRLRHLADMTSGLPDDRPARDRPVTTAKETWQRYAVLEAYGRDDFFRDLAGVSLTAEPGTNPGHSNVASILLGYVLEDVYGRPYRALVAEAIETPAGMTGQAEGEADSINAAGEAMPRLAGVGYAIAAGGLSYTPRDLGRFMRHILSSQSPAVALSLKPGWKTLDGEAAISLGWIWRRSGPAGAHYQASGGTFAFASYTDIYPACRIGLSFVQNAGDDASQGELGKLAEGFAAAMAPEGCAAG